MIRVRLPITARKFAQASRMPASKQQVTLSPSEERSFLESLRLSNAVSRLTYAGRLAAADDMLIRHLESLRSSSQVKGLDVGCSSGVSTLELLLSLRAKYVSVELCGADILTKAWIVRGGPGFYVLVDDGGFPLQYDLFGLAIRPWSRGRREWLTGAAILRLVANAVYAVIRRTRGLFSEERLGNLARQGSGDSIQAVDLVVRELVQEEGVAVINHDIFDQFPAHLAGVFDFARAANLLNIGYFSNEQIVLALRNIRRTLKGVGSLLLVCRTIEGAAHEPGSTNGSLFMLTELGAFKLVERLGAGSEIEQVVLAI